MLKNRARIEATASPEFRFSGMRFRDFASDSERSSHPRRFDRPAQDFAISPCVSEGGMDHYRHSTLSRTCRGAGAYFRVACPETLSQVSQTRRKSWPDRFTVAKRHSAAARRARALLDRFFPREAVTLRGELPITHTRGKPFFVSTYFVKSGETSTKRT